MANEEETMNQEEVTEEGQAENESLPDGETTSQPSKGKVAGSIEGALEKKVKKRLLIGFLGSACACCLPIIVILASISIVTIVVFYIQGFFDSNSETTPQTSVSQPTLTK